ncbi:MULTISPECIES: T9SS type A sorting domain-containing protein [unclassified Polaribacter]|uniref:T9SS type A sorting domain-containing protein n=1 Tax=unclassified Polaribacter TaxID=196858 RepID=UPI0011BF2C1E|nr:MULTISPECIES: T9SS type A sorting domain-containing protein [unclassified Polaribacter]TXD54279.1 T9SS type A sorting domain-containing protein [Polaribacter sp. IC063]TXD62890.1 T9SS type A sorting domain-containing protein [Polaribacter sp. IC066]
MKHKNILKIALTLFLAIGTNNSFGQTVLEKGDIAIIAISTGQEQFTFVTFKDLEQETEIFFTDEEADGSSTIGAGEGTVKYTTPTGGVLAGTVISGNSNGSATNFTPTTDGSLILGNSGDGILAYQGSLGNVTSFLHAVGKDESHIGSFPINTLTSSDYLLLGGDDGSYSGITTGTMADLFAAINEVTNWTVSSSADINPISSFTVTVSEPTVGFNTTASSQTETDTSFNITIPITASGHDGNNIDISIAVSGTAEVNDYTLNTTSLSFTSNSSQNISLDINPDNDDLDDEEIILTLTETSSVSGLIISQNTHTITVTEDETPEGPLYNADFTNDDDGFADHTTSSPPADGPASAGPFGEPQNQWSLSYNTTPSSDTTTNSFKVVSGKLETIDWGGEGVFESQSINISRFSTIDIAGLGVTLSNKVQNVGTEFFKYYYILDGGIPIETNIILTEDTDGTSVNYSITNLDVSVASTLIVGFAFNCSGGTTGYSISSFKVTDSSPSTITWDGSESADWATTNNWDTNTVPIASDNVIIPEVTTAPIIGATTGAVVNDLTITEPDGIHITAGGSLIVAGSSTGNITYNIAVSDQWHLVSSPVVGESYNDTWANANSIADGTGTNRGISTYQNGTRNETTGPWVYMQDGESKTFDSGKGYSLKRASNGTYSFTGTYPNTAVNPTISTNINTWNLIGNPYPAYIDIAAFISENTVTNNNLADSFSAIYVWNPTSGETGAYKDLTTGYLHPAQAFFVNSKVDGTASFTKALQSHEIGITFYKNSNTSIDLVLSTGKSTKKTKINYLDDKTTGLDVGSDIGMFNGVASDIRIYTHLIENNEGIAFSRQALPKKDIESLVVPVGIKAAINTEITFSAKALHLPNDIKVFLEDRYTNTFTRLDAENNTYQVTLKAALNGIGRFYLHTKSNSVLNTDKFNLKNISIYKTDNFNLRIVGLPQGIATVKLFNMLGKQMIKASFTSNGVHDIYLPNLASGIYIVQIETATGSINKKITLE